MAWNSAAKRARSRFAERCRRARRAGLVQATSRRASRRAPGARGKGARASTGSSSLSSSAPSASSLCQPDSRSSSVERREARRHGHRIARERARLVGIPVGREARHDAPRAPPKAPTGMPPPITLPKVARSGRDAEELGRAAAAEAKARDHLVEDQQRAVRARERAQGLEELAPLRQQAVIGGHRLDDDGGDARALAREQRRQRRLVIERQHARAGGEGLRHAGGGRPAEGREPRARRDQQMIGVPVVAAGELHDQVAPGEGARHADRAHHRLGARGHEAHLLGGRIGGRRRARPAPPPPRRARRRSCRAPAAALTAATTAGCACPAISGPQEHTRSR